MGTIIGEIILEAVDYIFDVLITSETGILIADAIGYAAVFFAVAKAAQALFGRSPPGGFQQGLEVSVVDPLAGARIIIGHLKVGGVHCIPPFNSGDNGEIAHLVLALAGHQVSAYQNVYSGQDCIFNTHITSVTGTANDGVVTTGGSTLLPDGVTINDKWSSNHWLRRYDGTQTAVDYILHAAYPSAFTSDFVGHGIAYAAIAMKLDKNSNAGQIPQWTFEVNGALVYDPRLDSTQPGGSGSQRYTDSTTWTYSNNPALCAAWLTMNADLGGGYDPTWEIDWLSVAAAANICDFSLTGGNAPPSGSQSRYTCAALLDATNDFSQNLRVLVDAMAGLFVNVDGVWKFYAGAWTTPSASLNYTDFVGPVSIQCITPRDTTGQATTNRYNGVRGFFIDPTHNWQRKECPPRKNDTYMTADGGERIWKEVELPAITDVYQCERVSEFMLRQSRDQVVVTGLLGPKWLNLATYDTVTLTWPDMGWNAKTFRVVSYIDDPTAAVQIALREENSTDWTDLTTSQYDTPDVPNIPTTSPTVPTAPTNFAGVAYPGAVDFTWTDAVLKPVDSYYRIVESSVNSYAQANSVWSGNGTRAFLAMPNTATNYFWIDSLSAAGVKGGTTPGPSSGYAIGARLVQASDVASGSAAYVTFQNCTVSQLFSGTGILHLSQIGRIDIPPTQVGGNANVLVTITCRAQQGNVNGTNALQAQFITGVTSSYSGPDQSGLGTGMTPMTLQGQFPYTAGNSAAVILAWDVSSGNNSITVDQVVIKAEFIKL